ncbi:glycosyltransferase 87 family protein, partial [Rhabdothermincola sp.]|uniref:glycosyltransferase 87 family protein n=1 Tax=Rhabdothermincola sp. TaxID=2820405 RepID=UPI002FE10ED1
PRATGGSSRWAWLALLLIAIRIVSVVAVLHSGVEEEHSILGGDALRYETITSSDGWPYRDFEVEYPPVTLAVLELVVGQDHLDTLTRLAVSQLVADLAVAALLGWGWGRRSAVAYLLLGTPMVLFPFPYLRIDLVSVLLAVLGLALLRRAHEISAGTSLALAVLAKLWPLAVLPRLLVERRWRALATVVVVGSLGTAIWLGLGGIRGVEQVVSYRGARGWQIESLPGAVLHLLDPAASRLEQGAWRTGTPMPGWSRPLLTLASLSTVVAAWWLVGRGPDRSPRVLDGVAPLAAVVGLLVFSPIISPQYVVWLMPFVAIAAAHGERVLGWLGLAVSALTTFILASIHAQIEGRLYAMLPILVRNGLLVAMLVLALRTLGERSTGPATDGAEVRSSLSA